MQGLFTPIAARISSVPHAPVRLNCTDRVSVWGGIDVSLLIHRPGEGVDQPS